MRGMGWWVPGAAVLLAALGGCGGDDGGASDAGHPCADCDVDAWVGPSPDAGVDAGPEDGGAVDGSTADGGPPPDPLDGAGDPELVQDGFEFLEGPQWRTAEGDLLFSDIPANTIYRLVEPDGVDTFRSPSDNANGLAVDTEGRLLACEHGSREVTRTLAGGSRETLAATFEGSRLNSPNDIEVRSDGTLYFTDPPYGIDASARELDFNGVFRVAPGGTLTAEHRGSVDSRPNGLALSPDESVLYVDDTVSGDVDAWDVATDGSLSGMRHFATTAGNPDGMAVDEHGNVYVTTTDGVEVFAPDGSRWGALAFPMQPANCGFGGAELRTLYVTARQALYRVHLPVRGIP